MNALNPLSTNYSLPPTRGNSFDPTTPFYSSQTYLSRRIPRQDLSQHAAETGPNHASQQVKDPGYKRKGSNLSSRSSGRQSKHHSKGVGAYARSTFPNLELTTPSPEASGPSRYEGHIGLQSLLATTNLPNSFSPDCSLFSSLLADVSSEFPSIYYPYLEPQQDVHRPTIDCSTSAHTSRRRHFEGQKRPENKKRQTLLPQSSTLSSVGLSNRNRSFAAQNQEVLLSPKPGPSHLPGGKNSTTQFVETLLIYTRNRGVTASLGHLTAFGDVWG